MKMSFRRLLEQILILKKKRNFTKLIFYTKKIKYDFIRLITDILEYYKRIKFLKQI